MTCTHTHTQTSADKHLAAALHAVSRRIQISRLESCLGRCVSESAELSAAAASARTTAPTLRMVSRGWQRGTLLKTGMMSHETLFHSRILSHSRLIRFFQLACFLLHSFIFLLPELLEGLALSRVILVEYVKYGDMLGISGQYGTPEGSRHLKRASVCSF